MKKIIKLILIIIVVYLFVKGFIFLSNFITHKEEIDAIKTEKKQVTEAQAYAFIQAVEQYCSLELVKGRPLPDRITNPKEILMDGTLPRTMDVTLTDDCKAKGTFTYGNTTYKYDYKTKKLTTD